VINEVEALREYLDTLDGDGESDLPENLKREVQELKRIGFEVKEMGERKLKGLEGE
jgi:adenylate cyclase